MTKKIQSVEMPPFHELCQAWDELLAEGEQMTTDDLTAAAKQQKPELPLGKQRLRSGLPSYRKKAMEAYSHICAYCGFGIAGVLEVAHLDCDPRNCDLSNLALLCPTCHRMHDLDLIPTEVIKSLRDNKRTPNWKKLMKDAAAKAEATKKKSRAAKKAHKTRQERKKLGTETN
jgi:predicted restriction endonuclease